MQIPEIFSTRIKWLWAKKCCVQESHLVENLHDALYCSTVCTVKISLLERNRTIGIITKYYFIAWKIVECLHNNLNFFGQ